MNYRARNFKTKLAPISPMAVSRILKADSVSQRGTPKLSKQDKGRAIRDISSEKKTVGARDLSVR